MVGEVGREFKLHGHVSANVEWLCGRHKPDRRLFRASLQMQSFSRVLLRASLMLHVLHEGENSGNSDGNSFVHTNPSEHNLHAVLKTCALQCKNSQNSLKKGEVRK